MGYCRARRVRPTETAVIPRDRPSLCLLRNRLPELSRECHGQGITRSKHSRDLALTRSQWYPEVLHFCPTTPLVLVGLKSDLRNKRTCIELLRTQGLTPVTPEQGAAVAQQMGAKYIECSAKENKGIQEVFELAINTAIQAEDESYQVIPDKKGVKVKKAKRSKCVFL